MNTARDADALPAELIRRKRDGGALSTADIQGFVKGLTDDSWTEGQIAALAMAVCLRGMTREECTDLTHAMMLSGEVFDWRRLGVHGPVLDKHSTGGVGDKVSLVLAPLVAACGGVVPMLSGRGLGHTGGTLDKLSALPGYVLTPDAAQIARTLRLAGCAIFGATASVAPADRRLYAIRDVTGTIESVPLITASILSKKLAAGLDALVLDVKVGNGAFCKTITEAEVLAGSLLDVAAGAGLRTRALITDMNQVLGHSAGNALELQEAMAMLTGQSGLHDVRLKAVVFALAAELLCLCGLAATLDKALLLVERALDDGRAAEMFARMVAAMGGPADVLGRSDDTWAAPVQRDVPAPFDGIITGHDVRDIGMVVLALGGGRRCSLDPIDVRVGVSRIQPPGTEVRRGDPMARIHSDSQGAADAASIRLIAAIHLGTSWSGNAEPLVRCPASQSDSS